MAQAILEEIKKNLKSENLILGTDRTLKLLRQGKLKTIAVASNIPKDLEEDLERYSKLAGITFVKLEMPNDELGTYCKKPFSVSVIGIL